MESIPPFKKSKLEETKPAEDTMTSSPPPVSPGGMGMGGVNSSVDGDGPQQVPELQPKSSDPDTGWANLPPPVFHKLYSHCSPSFVYIARQVCPNWLANTEYEIGLNVKVDDSIPGNRDFVQSVKVVQARVVNWTGPGPSGDPTSSQNLPSTSALESGIFQFPSCLQKLILTGSMPPSWKFKDLLMFPNLTHLVLRGMALHSQDMTGSPLPDAREEFEVNPDGDITLESYNPPTESPPISLRKLRKLEIIMNEYSYPSPLPLSVRLSDPDRAMEYEFTQQRLFLVVLNNVSYILNNIRSRHLHAVQIYVYPKAGSIPPQKINWRHQPLQSFLDNHKKVLKELYLPDFEGKHDNTNVDLSSFPTKLRKLQLTLSRYIGDREESREQSCQYWGKFLSEQTLLQDVYLIISELSSEWIQDNLSSMSFSSKECLQYVDIVIQNEDTIFFNLEVFAFCHALQIFKLSGRDNEIVIRNFGKLPSSLRKLYVNMAFVEFPDPQFISKFEHLEMLELKTIMAGEGHPQTFDFFHGLLHLRTLCLLSLTFDCPLNSNPVLRSILQEMTEHFDSSYPSYTFKLNLNYEVDAGWGEETFDEEKLDIEYINSREPEDYTQWHTRHRNAISVDDEDHRIFMFQTLPFLLNLRGRRAAGVVVDDDDISDDDDDDAIAESNDSRLSTTTVEGEVEEHDSEF